MNEEQRRRARFQQAAAVEKRIRAEREQFIRQSRTTLELAKLKHEIDQEKTAVLHAERVRVYGPAKAEELRRADVIRELEARVEIAQAEINELNRQSR